MTSAHDIQGSGPYGGKVLAWSRGEEETIVVLADSGDGSVRELARTPDTLAAAAVAPDGREWYWVSRREGQVAGVWRQAVAGGAAEKVLDGWDVESSYGDGADLDWALDDSLLVVSSRTTTGHQFRIIDLPSGRVTELLDTGQGQVVGFLGRELVAYPGDSDSELNFPLIAIDPTDGSMRDLIEGSTMGRSWKCRS